MNKIIVGLGHKARQGKSEVANSIEKYCKEKGLTSSRPSISEIIRLHLVALRRLPAKLERKDMLPVHIQALADHSIAMRAKDSRFWVDKLNRMITLMPEVDVVIVENVRFDSEVAAVKECKGRSGYLAKVERFELGKQVISDDRDATQDTEVALDYYQDWDFRLRNDKDLNWLDCQSRAVMDYLFERESK